MESKATKTAADTSHSQSQRPGKINVYWVPSEGPGERGHHIHVFCIKTVIIYKSIISNKCTTDKIKTQPQIMQCLLSTAAFPGIIMGGSFTCVILEKWILSLCHLQLVKANIYGYFILSRLNKLDEAWCKMVRKVLLYIWNMLLQEAQYILNSPLCMSLICSWIKIKWRDSMFL